MHTYASRDSGLLRARASPQRPEHLRDSREFVREPGATLEIVHTSRMRKWASCFSVARSFRSSPEFHQNVTGILREFIGFH